MAGFEDSKRVWRAIHERESARRRNLDELLSFMEKLGESRKSAKSLLKLIIYTNGIKASEAAEIIGVKRHIIDQWLKILTVKKLVDIESPTNPNPKINPAKGLQKRMQTHYRQSPVKIPTATPVEEPEEDEGYYEEDPDLESQEIKDEQKNDSDPEPSDSSDVDLEPGSTYLFLEDKTDSAIRNFMADIRGGLTGVYITRSNPTHVRKRYYMPDTKIVWLTNMQTDGSEQTVHAMEDLYMMMVKFINENPRGILMLDGLEYLTINNNFQNVLKFIQQVRDKVSTTDGKLVLRLNPAALDQRQLSLLKVESKTIDLT